MASVVFASAIAVSATSTYAFYTISEKFRIAGLRMTIDHDDAVFKLGKKDENGEVVFHEDAPYTLSDFGYEGPTLGNISNMFHSRPNEYPSTYDETFNPYFYDGYHIGGSTTKTNRMQDRFEDGFVQMEFYVLCSENAFIYLSPDSSATPAHDANVDTARTRGVSVGALDNVVNASRVSFYSNYGYVIAELGEHEDVSYAGRLDLGGDGYFDAASDGKEILYGSYEGSSLVYEDEPLEEDIAITGHKDIFHANSRAGNYQINETASTLNVEREDAHPLSYYMFADAYSNAHPIAVAKANTPTRLVVSVYLEGWDFDMTNDLILASFGFELGFVAVFDPASGQYFS